jgi:hypothetical protein
VIKIDDNIPAPSRRVTDTTEAIAALEVGQSFFTTTRSSLSGSLSYRRPKKFVTRSTTEGGVKGTRIWRTE